MSKTLQAMRHTAYYPKQAHVICCNDAIMAVVIGTEEQAEAAMEPLIEADYQRHKGYHNGAMEYLSRLYWHIHTVRLLIPEDTQ